MSSPKLHVNNTNESILFEKGPRTLRGVKDGTLLMLDILRKLDLDSQIEVLMKNVMPIRNIYLILQGNHSSA